MKRAKIIVIEGTDGSGKESQSKKVLEYLENKGLKVKRYSFPVYSSATGKIVGSSWIIMYENENGRGKGFWREWTLHVTNYNIDFTKRLHYFQYT